MEEPSLGNFQQEIVKLEEARKIYQMGRYGMKIKQKQSLIKLKNVKMQS